MKERKQVTLYRTSVPRTWDRGMWSRGNSAAGPHAMIGLWTRDSGDVVLCNRGFASAVQSPRAPST
jgi:hypothetical protein